jgi:hypothetical protein
MANTLCADETMASTEKISKSKIAADIGPKEYARLQEIAAQGPEALTKEIDRVKKLANDSAEKYRAERKALTAVENKLRNIKLLAPYLKKNSKAMKEALDWDGLIPLVQEQLAFIEYFDSPIKIPDAINNKPSDVVERNHETIAKDEDAVSGSVKDSKDVDVVPKTKAKMDEGRARVFAKISLGDDDDDDDDDDHEMEQ